jgi:hypothetical protein
MRKLPEKKDKLPFFIEKSKGSSGRQCSREEVADCRTGKNMQAEG